MSEPEAEPTAPEPESIAIQDAGAVAVHGDVRLTGAVVAGRDLRIDALTVLSDDGPPHGDAVTRPGAEGDVCPYAGLDPFDAGHATFFHGRVRDVRAVLGLLAGASPVGVIGSSGSGKSSLLAAGVLPALAHGEPAGAQTWSVVTLRPGTQPVEQLAARIAALLPDATLDVVAAQIRADPASFVAWDARIRGTGAGQPLWVVDQLEEVFHAAVDAPSRRAFLAALAAARPGGPRVLVALRSDFYPHLDQAPELAAALAAAQHRVLPPGTAAVREIVERPAEQVGLRVEPALVEKIVEDVAGVGSVLPLLSYALAQTWRRRRNGWLTLAGYVDAGGLDEAIDRGAESVWETLDEPQRRTARRLLLRLAHLGEGAVPVRRTSLLDELVTDADDLPAVRDVVDRLAAARIVTVDLDAVTGLATVDITHEALLREWGLLRGWLAEDRDAKRAQEDVSTGASAWRRHGRDAGYLLRGARLSVAEAARRAGTLTLNDAEAHFLAQSRRADRRQRLRSRLVVVLAAALAAAMVVTGVVYVQQRRIAQEKQTADALRLAAQSASALTQHRDLAALLAVAAVGTDDNPDTRGAVVDAVATRGGPLAYLPADLHARSLAPSLTLDGSVLVGTADRTVRVVSPVDGHDTAPPLTGHEADVVSVVVVDDLVTSGDAAGFVLVHRPGTAAPIAAPARASSNVTAVAMDPSRSVVMAATAFGPVERWRLTDALVPLPPLPDSAGVTSLGVDDGQVVGVTTDGALRRWQLADGAALPDLAAPGTLGSGTALRLSAGPGRLVTVDGTRIGLWDVHSGQATFADVPGAESVAVTPDGGTAFVGTATGSVTTWQLTPGLLAVEPVRAGLGPDVTALAVDGPFLVGMDGGGQIVSWDLTGRRSPAGVPVVGAAAETPVAAVAQGPDGVVASGGLEGGVRLTRGPDSFAPFPVGAPVTSLLWPIGGPLFAGTGDGRVVAIDPAAGSTTTPLTRPGSAVVALAGHDARSWFAGFADGRVVAADGTVVAGGRPVTALAVSADGRDLAVASWDGASPPEITLRAGTAPWAVRATLRGHDLEIGSLAFSPDGTVLASGSDDRTIRLWSTDDGRIRAVLTGHTDYVLALAFTPDGRSLASGSQDGTIRIRDMTTLQPIGQPLEFGSGYVTALSASSDGRRLVAANGQAVVEWPFAPPAWIDTACRFAHRGITAEEWDRLSRGSPTPPPRCSPSR